MSVTKSSRDLRQEQCVQKWLNTRGKGTIVAATGFGKTSVATIIIGHILSKFPDKRILIVVPTITLKEQWTGIIDKLGFSLNCDIQVINTIISRSWECDLLIIDECQRVAADTFSKVFLCVTYKLILGLTATFERLDGKHETIAKYCPVCDTVSLTECLLNGWISPYKLYFVLVDVDDIEQYKTYNKQFVETFGFFNFEFDLAMSMKGPKGYLAQINYRDKLCGKDCSEEKKKEVLKAIKFHSARFTDLMKLRKKFINNHPKKIELAQQIIEARPFSKIVTFSNNVDMAKSVGFGDVYTGKTSKKKGEEIIQRFNNEPTGVLNTCFRANEGLDIKGLSVGIVLGTNSSSIQGTQRIGRICRFEEGKQAEMFYIIINHTVEVDWAVKANSKQEYKFIDEKGLQDVLNGKEPASYCDVITKSTYRY
jgi:superfamily II DNA or RNA helicase